MYDIYSGEKNDQWRFTLGKSGNRKLFTIGLNPSTASQEKSDTTVAKVEAVATRAGYDGFVMLNLYPVRATDFNKLPNQVNIEAFSTNLASIEAIVKEESDPVIWAAWGENILAREYFFASAVELIARLKKYNVSWRRFGDLTKSGHPRHPSRLHYAWDFWPLDIQEYLQKTRI